MHGEPSTMERSGPWEPTRTNYLRVGASSASSVTIHKIQILPRYVTGDLFDEGQYSRELEFNAYVERFKAIFHVPDRTKLFVAVGNHDIGFHYRVTPYLDQRFSEVFDSPSVNLISLAGSHFVLINSMAMEGDGCFLCRSAELLLSNISSKLFNLGIF